MMWPNCLHNEGFQNWLNQALENNPKVSISCRACGSQATIYPNEKISENDPRLCPHMKPDEFNGI